MRQWKRRYKVMLGIWMVTVVSYVLAWRLPKVVDWYRNYLFPVGTNTLARLMSVFPFSVGELLIYFGIGIFAVGVFVGFFCLFFKKKVRRFAKYYWEFIVWVLVWIAVTETFHCFVLYHATTVEEMYFSDVDIGQETLLYAYQMLVENANQLSVQMERNAEGEVVYNGDLYAECRAAMQALGEEYPYLRGYYPNPKKIWMSDFMSQQYLSGIYFPFTLEANYNTTMYIMNQPATICHEFSHLKGVILEDEANFFGFLACIRSQDPFVAYSGYLSVLPYVSREVRKTVDADTRNMLTQPNEYVQKDVVFLTEESWNRVEEKAIMETEKVNEMTNAFLEGNLRSNGVTEGIVSYSRVVRLVVKWYQKERD